MSTLMGHEPAGWLDTKENLPTLEVGDEKSGPSEETLMRLKLAMAASAVVVSVVMMGTTRAGDEIKSGQAVGEHVGPFQVDDVTGPNKGQTLCYR